jgi:hypothetical protein
LKIAGLRLGRQKRHFEGRNWDIHKNSRTKSESADVGEVKVNPLLADKKEVALCKP